MNKRNFAAPRIAAGALVALAMFSAACGNDSASRMTSPQLKSSSISGVTAFNGSSAALSASAPSLGLAANFAALGGTGVTCTVPNPALPATTVTGNVGSVSVAASSVTGFPGFGASLCRLSGTVQLGATAASLDMITAYNSLRDNNTCPSANASHNLAGSLVSGSQGATLEPGVYCISGTGLLTSRLTLNGGGNSNAVWIFRAATDLTPKNGSVVMANSGNACNVYWQVGTAVDLLNTAFVGNVLAGTAITFTGTAPRGTASSLAGRALAQTDVTMTGASITACAAGSGNGNGNGDDDDKDHGKGGDKDHGKGGHGDDHGHGRGGHHGDRDRDHGDRDRDHSKGESRGPHDR